MLALFEEEFRPAAAAEALARVADEERLDQASLEHATQIVTGVLQRLAELDAEIGARAPLIPVTELGRVERTILRSATWEVLYSAAAPARDTIRDAETLAATYAGEAARRLVNGVLRSIAAASGRGA